VLPLHIQVLVHAGCACQCQGRGLAGCCPQSVGRCPEAGGVIKQLLISQRWVQVPIIDILLSLEWWSMSCWSLKDDSKSQPSTFSWVFSSCQWVANLSKLSSIPSYPWNCESWVVLNKLMSSQSWVQLPIMDKSTPSLVSLNSLTNECMLRPWLLTSPFCRWLSFFVSVTQTLFIDVKWIGTELVSRLNDTCLGQAPLCLWCLVAHMQACVRCMNASTELVCMVCQKVLSRFLRRIAENHRGYKAWCFLLLWTNSLLDAVAS